MLTEIAFLGHDVEMFCPFVAEGRGYVAVGVMISEAAFLDNTL